MTYIDKNKYREMTRRRYKEKREDNTYDAIRQKYFSLNTRVKNYDSQLDPRWEDYGAFKEWMVEELSTLNIDSRDCRSISNYDLDKDASNTRIYGPDTCILIPHKLNVMLNTQRDSGICKRLSGRYSVRAYNGSNQRVSLGTYDTLNEAKEISNNFSYQLILNEAETLFDSGIINRRALNIIKNYLKIKFK